MGFRGEIQECSRHAKSYFKLRGYTEPQSACGTGFGVTLCAASVGQKLERRCGLWLENAVENGFR